MQTVAGNFSGTGATLAHRWRLIYGSAGRKEAELPYAATGIHNKELRGKLHASGSTIASDAWVVTGLSLA